MGRRLTALCLLAVAGCGEDLEPTGVTTSGTLIVRAEVEGWALPGTVFEAVGSSGALTLTASSEGVATRESVVPGEYTITIRTVDADARFDAESVQTSVRPDFPDTLVLSGSFDPGEFRQVVVGNAVICALSERGNPYCWGLGEAGELGTGSVGRSGVPVRARAPEPLTQLAAGSLHMCGLGESGAAYCWGLNASGRLGTGTEGTERPFIPLPTPVAGGVTFSQIAAGGSFACGLQTGSGRAWCWGAAGAGQLGNGTRTGTASSPVPVDTEERFAALSIGESWAGPRSVAARTDDGRVFVWGASPAETASWLAFSGLTPVEVPLPGPALAASAVCALLDASVVCWPDLMGQVPSEVLDVLLPTTQAGVREYTTSPLDRAFFEGGLHCREMGPGYDCTESWAFPLPFLEFGGEQVVQAAGFGRGGCVVTDVGRVWCWSGDFFIPRLAAGPGFQ